MWIRIERSTFTIRNLTLGSLFIADGYLAVTQVGILADRLLVFARTERPTIQIVGPEPARILRLVGQKTVRVHLSATEREGLLDELNHRGWETDRMWS